MYKILQIVVIKFPNIKGMKGSEIFQEMQNVLCNFAPSYAIECTRMYKRPRRTSLWPPKKCHGNGNDH